MKKTLNYKIILALLLIPTVFGIFFMTILIEEAFHVAHAGGAKSVCVDFNLKINDSIQQGYLTAHTVFEPSNRWGNVEAFYSWREYSEKIAGILQYVMTTVLALTVGFLSSELIHKTKGDGKI